MMSQKQRSSALVFLSLLVMFVASYTLSVRVDAYKEGIAPPSMNTGTSKGGPQLSYILDGTAIHDVGRFWLQLTNLGIVGNPWYAVSQRLSAEWPPGSGNEYLYAAGLWIGGIDPRDRQPHVSTALLNRGAVPERRSRVHRGRGSGEARLHTRRARRESSGAGDSARREPLRRAPVRDLC